MELRGCPDGKDSSQECFDRHIFEFVEDMAYGMPAGKTVGSNSGDNNGNSSVSRSVSHSSSIADPNHLERGYYWGGQGASGVDFAMKFRIPTSLVGEKVMLQWHYITANSCSPPGYTDYFGGNNSMGQVLPDEYWSPLVSDCVLPYPQDGATSGVWPEHFFNCAEVAVLGDPEPTVSPVVSPVVPTTKAPTILIPSPTNPPQSVPTNPPQMENPTDGGNEACCSQDFKTCVNWCTESKESCENCPEGLTIWLADGPSAGTCLARWATCTDNQGGCCNGLICRGDQYYMQCQHPSESGVITDPMTPAPAPAAPDDVCGEEWASCFHGHNFCCEDHYCDLSTVKNNYAHCRRSPDACLLEWTYCNDNPGGCCEELTCKGDPSWMTCQK